MRSTVTGKFLAHGFAEPHHIIELSETDITENQDADLTEDDTNVPVELVVPQVHSNESDQDQAEEDDIHTITTDDEDESRHMQRVMCHSPKMCNASVVFNRL